MLNGGSCLIGPDGNLLTEPAFDQEGIIYIEIDINTLQGERMNLATSGHYQRHDVFKLEVDKNRI